MVPSTPVTCPLDCPDACGMLALTDEQGALVRVRGNPGHPHNRGTLCGKTAIYADVARSPERLLEPLVRQNGQLVPASWSRALARITERVRALPGERILSAHYAGSMGQIARRFPLRVMNALGATDVDGGLCDNTATAGWQAVFGRVVGAPPELLAESDFVLVWGADLARTHQHLVPPLRRVLGAGGSAAVVDVWRTDTVRRVEGWGGRGVLLRPGSDAALALALARLAFERGRAERAFLERECAGADEFEAHVRSYTPEMASAATGLDPAEIERLYEDLARAERPFLKIGVGFTRRRCGGESMRAVCSLAAVLGIAERTLYETFDTFGLRTDAIERPDLRPAGAPERRIAHVRLGSELESGRFGAVFVWGHNPAVTCPDAGAVRRGLERHDVFVVVHEQFLTETAERADVVLPATCFLEHADVYRSYGHRYLTRARRVVEPPGQARSNVAAFAALARALDLPRACWDVSEEGLCDELLEASAERLSAGDRQALEDGRPVRMEPPAASGWGTPSGRVELASDACQAAGRPRCATWVPEREDADLPLALIAAPSVHTHNSTYHHSPRHLRRAGPPRVFAHPEEAAARGWVRGAPLRLSNRHGAITLPLELDACVPPGAVRVDGMPRARDVPEGVGINVLVPPDLSDHGDGNVLYSTRVRAVPASGADS